MKPYINIFIAISLVLVSCNNEPKEDFTILKGKITNSNLTELKLNSDDQYFKYNIPLNEDGSFIDTLNLKDDRYTLFDGEHSVITYIGKGNELTVTYDFTDFENTLNVEGEGSKMTYYFIEKNKISRAEYESINDLFALDEEAFKSKIDSSSSALTAMIPNSPWISKSFIDKEKRSIHYAYLDKLNQYQQRHRYITKQPKFVTSEGFLDEIKEVDFNIVEDYQYTVDYKNLIARDIGKKALALRQKDSIGFNESFFEVIKSIENDSIRNMFLFDNMRYMILSSGDLDKIYKSFRELSTNENHIKDITEIYNSLKKVSKGNISPKFVNYENHSGTVTSLDDLKGSYVYIDIWATWCAPCKAEIPFLKKIEKKYHGKNIKFVSISVDKKKDHDKWKKMVTDMNLTGIQLFADNDFKSDFIKEYSIRAIPRFILIDPKGVIVDGKAPRPSSKKLVELLDELEL